VSSSMLFHDFLLGDRALMGAGGEGMNRWWCENIFCDCRSICQNFRRLEHCTTRKRFLNFLLKDKRLSDTKWGKHLIVEYNKIQREISNRVEAVKGG